MTCSSFAAKMETTVCKGNASPQKSTTDRGASNVPSPRDVFKGEELQFSKLSAGCSSKLSKNNSFAS